MDYCYTYRFRSSMHPGKTYIMYDGSFESLRLRVEMLEDAAKRAKKRREHIENLGNYYPSTF